MEKSYVVFGPGERVVGVKEPVATVVLVDNECDVWLPAQKERDCYREVPFCLSGAASGPVVLLVIE